MKQTGLLAAACVALASCQTMADSTASDAGPAESDQIPYKALGTEPFWSLTIDGRNMLFNHEEEVFATSVIARSSFNGWRYTSQNMTADVTFSECSDGMSDFTYKDTVTVLVGGKEYKGCGGGIIVPKTLEATQWTFRSINAVDVPSERNATLTFQDGRMSGSVGCNQLNASYGFENKVLSFGPVMSTRMACPDPVGAQENALLGLLGTAFTTDFPGDGTMVLSSKNASVTLKQVI